MADEPDGAVDAFFTRMLGRSYRTTGLGIVALLCGILVVLPGVPSVVVEVCKVVLPLASGGGLMLAKDHRISGKPPN